MFSCSIGFSSTVLACECRSVPAPEPDAYATATPEAQSRSYLRSLLHFSKPPHVFIADVADLQPEAITIEQARAKTVVMPMQPHYRFKLDSAVVLRGEFPKDGRIFGGAANCNQRMSPFSERDNKHPRRWIIFADQKYGTSICDSWPYSESLELALRGALEDLRSESPSNVPASTNEK